MTKADMIHEGLLCLEGPASCIEDIPAEYEIDEEYSTATLVSFKIGSWECTREDAVKATGEEHVARQEAGALEAWRENAEERALGLADYLYEQERDRRMEEGL